jgi:hypothetical protein
MNENDVTIDLFQIGDYVGFRFAAAGNPYKWTPIVVRKTDKKVIIAQHGEEKELYPWELLTTAELNPK